MTPLEMATEAAKCIATGSGLAMTVPKGMLPRSFPRGELLCENRIDGVVVRVYRFKPERVLNWLVVNGLTEVELTAARQLTIREAAPPPSCQDGSSG